MNANSIFLAACIPNALEIIGAPRIDGFLQALLSNESSLEKLAVQEIVKRALVERKEKLVKVLENWTVSSFSELIFCDTPEIAEFLLENFPIKEHEITCFLGPLFARVTINRKEQLRALYGKEQFPTEQLMVLLRQLIRKDVKVYTVTIVATMSNCRHLAEEIRQVIQEFEGIVTMRQNGRVFNWERGTVSISFVKTNDLLQ